MKYPIYILANQHPSRVIVQGKRDTFENIFKDFGDSVSNQRILSPVREQFRQHSSEIIKVRLSPDEARKLLSMVGLSY